MKGNLSRVARLADVADLLKRDSHRDNINPWCEFCRVDPDWVISPFYGAICPICKKPSIAICSHKSFVTEREKTLLVEIKNRLALEENIMPSLCGHLSHWHEHYH